MSRVNMNLLVNRQTMTVDLSGLQNFQDLARTRHDSERILSGEADRLKSWTEIDWRSNNSNLDYSNAMKTFSVI